MGKGEYASGDLTGEDPPWYWQGGLHDARLLAVEERQLAYDVHQRHPLRSCLVLHLDPAHALHPTNIRTICLYNAKTIGGELCPGRWWMCDTLTKHGEKYELTIVFTDGKNDHETVIRFDTAKTE